MKRGRIVDHIGPADWHAALAGVVAGALCLAAPTLIVAVLRWLA